MSGLVNFDRDTAVPDWPLEGDTGVTGLHDGFCTDEALVFGLADIGVVEKDS